MSAAVYFSPVITPEKVLDMFRLVDKTLPGNIAIKLHSGEKGNQNFLGPEFWKPVIDYVGGTVVECNTAYGGSPQHHREAPQADGRARLEPLLHGRPGWTPKAPICSWISRTARSSRKILSAKI